MNEVIITPATKSSFSSNSSSYTTPCQSPVSLGSLDSTNIDISLKSKDSVATISTDNRSLLLTTSNFSIYKERPGSCSSGSSNNSVKTLLPPSSSLSTKSDQINQLLNGSPSLVDHDNNSFENLMAKFNELQKDWCKVIGLEQQITQIGSQMTSLRETIGIKMNEICHEINNLAMGTPLSSFKQSNNGVNDLSNSLSSKINNGYKINCLPISVVQLQIPETVLTAEISSEKTELNELAAKKESLLKVCKSPIIKKLPAMVKGYLTRRLLTTERVKDLIKTIKDTTVLLENYRNEERVAREEIDFHRRLMIQLERSLLEFHEIFFNYSKAEQMKLISRSREIAIDRRVRFSLGMKKAIEPKPKKPIHDKRKDTSVSTVQPKQRKADPSPEPAPIKPIVATKTRRGVKSKSISESKQELVPSPLSGGPRRSQRATSSRSKRVTRSQATKDITKSSKKDSHSNSSSSIFA